MISMDWVGRLEICSLCWAIVINPIEGDGWKIFQFPVGFRLIFKGKPLVSGSVTTWKGGIWS